MKKYVTEHQSEYLDLSAEVSEILYEGKSEFQDIVVADSKEFGRMLLSVLVAQVYIYARYFLFG